MKRLWRVLELITAVGMWVTATAYLFGWMEPDARAVAVIACSGAAVAFAKEDGAA